MYISSVTLFACCIAAVACVVAALPAENYLPALPYTQGHDGRPGCRTEEEINRSWRNNLDPTRFWFCDALNENAIEVLCPLNGGYMNGICVPWYVWQWTPPFDPPTFANE